MLPVFFPASFQEIAFEFSNNFTPTVPESPCMDWPDIDRRICRISLTVFEVQGRQWRASGRGEEWKPCLGLLPNRHWVVYRWPFWTGASVSIRSLTAIVEFWPRVSVRQNFYPGNVEASVSQNGFKLVVVVVVDSVVVISIKRLLNTDQQLYPRLRQQL